MENAIPYLRILKDCGLSSTQSSLEKAVKGTPQYQDWLTKFQAHFANGQTSLFPLPKAEKEHEQKDLNSKPPKFVKDYDVWKEAVKSATADGTKKAKYGKTIAIYMAKLNAKQKQPMAGLAKAFEGVSKSDYRRALSQFGEKLQKATIEELNADFKGFLSEDLTPLVKAESASDFIQSRLKEQEDPFEIINSLIDEGLAEDEHEAEELLFKELIPYIDPKEEPSEKTSEEKPSETDKSPAPAKKDDAPEASSKPKDDNAVEEPENLKSAVQEDLLAPAYAAMTPDLDDSIVTAMCTTLLQSHTPEAVEAFLLSKGWTVAQSDKLLKACGVELKDSLKDNEASADQDDVQQQAGGNPAQEEEDDELVDKANKIKQNLLNNNVTDITLIKSALLLADLPVDFVEKFLK